MDADFAIRPAEQRIPAKSAAVKIVIRDDELPFQYVWMNVGRQDLGTGEYQIDRPRSYVPRKGKISMFCETLPEALGIGYELNRRPQHVKYARGCGYVSSVNYDMMRKVDTMEPTEYLGPTSRPTQDSASTQFVGPGMPILSPPTVDTTHKHGKIETAYQSKTWAE